MFREAEQCSTTHLTMHRVGAGSRLARSVLDLVLIDDYSTVNMRFCDELESRHV